MFTEGPADVLISAGEKSGLKAEDKTASVPMNAYQKKWADKWTHAITRPNHTAHPKLLGYNFFIILFEIIVQEILNFGHSSAIAAPQVFDL